MKTQITRICFALILLLIGVMCVVFYTNAKIIFYVSPSFHLSTLIGGLGMITVALFLLLTLKEISVCNHDHDHDHSELNPLLALVVIATPLIFALTNTEHRYSKAALDKKSSVEVDPNAFSYLNKNDTAFTREMLEEMKTKNANGAFQLEVIEIFYSAGDPVAMEVMEGLKVETQGAVRRQPGGENNPKVKRLYRMFMTCCATDMQPMPIKLILTESLAKDYQHAEHTWLKVEGTLSYESSNSGFKTPILIVEHLETTAPPPNEILSQGNSIMQHKL